MNILNLISCNLMIVQGAFVTIRNRSVRYIKESTCTDSEGFKLILHHEMKKICRHLQTIYKYENISSYFCIQ